MRQRSSPRPPDQLPLEKANSKVAPRRRLPFGGFERYSRERKSCLDRAPDHWRKGNGQVRLFVAWRPGRPQSRAQLVWNDRNQGRPKCSGDSRQFSRLSWRPWRRWLDPRQRRRSMSGERREVCEYRPSGVRGTDPVAAGSAEFEALGSSPSQGSQTLSGAPECPTAADFSVAFSE